MVVTDGGDANPLASIIHLINSSHPPHSHSNSSQPSILIDTVTGIIVVVVMTNKSASMKTSPRLAAVVALFLTLLLLLLFSSFPLIEAKHVEGTVSITSGKVSPLGKFSFRPEGTSTISGTVNYRGEDRGSLYVFMDTEWNDYHSNSDDCSRMQKATAQIPIGHYGKHMSTGKGQGHAEIKEENGMKQWTFDWEIEHRMRTYGYFLVIGDCSAAHGGKRFKSVTYSIDFFNDHKDHFPSDEHGLFTTYILVFLVLIGYLVSVYTSSLRQKGGRTVSVFNEVGF